jgi:hypothetical protein
MKLSVEQIISKLKGQQPPNAPSLGLKPLYPEKKKPGHDIYVRELDKALEDKGIHNIALTGSYGSGKSSILSDFEHGKEDRIIRVSLSTLGGGIEPQSNESGAGEDDKEELAKSIQKEIVKQLLFREAPYRVPHSKFKRIAASNLTRIFLFSALVAIAATAGIYYFWGASILYKLAGAGLWQVGVVSSLLVCIFSLVALVLLEAGGKFIINKLAGGPVTLSVSDKNNYFDEYLDELVYFFQVTEYDIVILEDIERFDNTYIFITLKQLNTLLNDSGQIRDRKKQIRFIYAIRDSLFSEGQPDVYKQSTNRAKFFDLIIPVVPFVTHQSSSDIISKIFNTDAQIGISRELIAIVAKHVTDMRLIKNIYNEYLVFSKKLLGEDKLEGLTKDKLFTMVVYKNTNLDDFEKVRRGLSQLDQIYEKYRQIIADKMTILRGQIERNKAKLESPESIASLSNEYGQKLKDFIEIATSSIQASNASYSLHGINYSFEQMEGSEFWEAVSKMGPSDSLNVAFTLTDQYNRSVSKSMLITRDKIGRIVAGSLDIEKLEAEDKESLGQENRQLRKELGAMPYRSIKQIMDTSAEFQSSVEAELGLGVTYDLLKADYIDANFALYTSIFHGTNPKAANFLIHHLQLNKPDIHYKFNGDENVEALLNDSGSAYLRSKSIYNIDILDYLLSTAKPGVNLDSDAHGLYHITNNLAQGQPEDLAFLDEYMRNGKQQERLIEVLGGKWARIFDYAVNSEAIDNAQRIRLFNSAFQGSNKEVQYIVDEGVTNYVIQNASRIELLTKPVNKTVKDKLGVVLDQLNAKLISFNGLSEDIKEVIVEKNLYTINQKNIEDATGAKNLSLDNILGANEAVFIYIAADLKAYLAAIADSKKTKHTIDSNESFPRVIDHIAKSGPEYLDDVIRGASPDCSIEDLVKVSSKAWPMLLDVKATEPRLSNILAYYSQDEAGVIDQHLTDYLNEIGRIEVDSSEDAENLERLAVAILSNTRIASLTRSKLVNDMDLKNYIPVDSFPAQNSDLYSHLVRDGIIEDSAATYNYLKASNPDTRLAYIVSSTNFSQYMNEVALDSDEISAISSSNDVKPEIKKYLINNLTSFDPKPSVTAINELASFAVANNMSLDVPTLHAMIGSINTVTAVKLINLSSESFTRDGMIGMFKIIGGDYEKLSQTKKHVPLDEVQHNIDLIARLRSLGMVSSVSKRKIKNSNKLVVNMKKSW